MPLIDALIWTCAVWRGQTAEVTGYTLLRARKGQGKALHQALTPMLRQVGTHPHSHNRHVQPQNRTKPLLTMDTCRPDI